MLCIPAVVGVYGIEALTYAPVREYVTVPLMEVPPS